MYDLKDSPFYKTWTPYSGKLTFLARFAILLLVVYISDLLAAIPGTLVGVILRRREFAELFKAAVTGGIPTMDEMFERVGAFAAGYASHPAYISAVMIGQVFLVIALVLYLRFAECRKAKSVGLTGIRSAAPSLASGAGIGLVLSLITLGLACATGAVKAVWGSANFGWIALFLISFVVSVFAEEFLYRGFFLTMLIIPGRSPWMAIGISTALYTFSAVGGGGILSIVNAALLGLLLSVLTIRTGNIWLATGIHGLWEFANHCIFGSFSNIPSVWRLVLAGGRELTSGGTAGLDNGLIATLVLLVGVTAALFIPSWKKNITTTVNNDIYS